MIVDAILFMAVLQFNVFRLLLLTFVILPNVNYF